ncbi:30S ribosomal protein S20 [Curtanaerobium respiraculi]|uniref:30S ribosomal protein S20 n=1 Tax=Curtanaerobium respiraculi TaxID=2949669 RepID=UPI0024B34B0C|nr:30S ribosomal protein S20 [Curtanaerobium respiraculi]
MANIKSQKKRILTNEKARKRNRAYKSELHTAVRAVREAAEAGNGAEAVAAAHKASRLLDKAASKGVIHKNQAANRKSGVMKLANRIATPEEIAAYKAPEKKQPVAKGGTKKAARKAERAAAYAEKAKAKEANRKEDQKAQASAEKRKAEEAAAAAAEAAETSEEAAE